MPREQSIGVQTERFGWREPVTRGTYGQEGEWEIGGFDKRDLWAGFGMLVHPGIYSECRLGS